MPTTITLKGVFPDTKLTKSKNFIRENVKNVHRISLQSTTKDEKNKIPGKIAERKEKRNVSTNELFSKRIDSDQRNFGRECCRQSKHDSRGKTGLSKSSLDLAKTSSESSIKQKKKASNLDRNKVTYVSRGIQTSFQVDESEEENFSNLNSERKNPSHKVVQENVNHSDESELEKKKGREKKCGDNQECDDKVEKEERHFEDKLNEATEYDVDPTSSNNINISNGSPNEHSQNKSKSNLTSKSKPSGPGHVHHLGVVPKYLLERKEALLKKKQEKEAELAQPTCPEGHILLPDQERKSTLAMLKKNYQDCINELNRLPIRSDTLRAHQKKIELEKKLNKLEEGIKVFSRPKVFVKVSS